MATAAEIAAAKALGFIAPTGNDMISNGDDAITENAAMAVRELKKRPLFAEALRYGKKWNSTDDLDTWWQHWAGGVAGAQGMPPGVGSAGMIQIEAGNGAWQRLWISFGIDAGIWLQWGNQNTGVWNPPTKLDTSDHIDSALAHELRVQDLQRRRGRTTTAKGVVVFVLDHGYSAFMDKAWPDLQARGFPVTWALNTVHPAAIDTGDTGLDWATIKNLAAANADTLEIAAHSANHGNVIERKNLLEAAIIGHKTELENLTGQRIDSWVQPGATLGRFVKDNPGSPDDYANTRAGRMIAATYACATGYVQSPRTFKLDGRPDLGIVGNWIDTGPGNVMTYINNVATNGGYTIVRLHPQYMDQTGYITRAQWQGVLDQIKTLVDAGTVEVMTLRDASVTTPADVAPAWDEMTGKPATFPPSGHKHDRLSRDFDSAQLRFTGGGGLQLLSPSGSLIWEVNSSGVATAGRVKSIGSVTGSRFIAQDSGVLDWVTGGQVKLRIDESGTLTVGTVPWDRIEGAPPHEAAQPERQAALSAHHAAMASAATETAAVAFVGSSTTAQGYYPGRVVENLAAAYGAGGGLVNAAEGAGLGAAYTGPGVTGYNFGDSGSDTRDYLTAETLDGLAVAQPSLIIHCIGSNDMARNMSPTQYETALRAAVDAIDARVTVPHRHVFASQQTRPGSFQYTPADYIAVNRVIADEIGATVFDFGPAMDSFDIYGADPLGLGLGDNLHMNAKGGEILGELVSDALNIPARETPNPALYDSGPRDITALATGVTSGTARFRVKHGWAQLEFFLQTDTAGATIFSSNGPLAPYAPTAPTYGRGFATSVNTDSTYRVQVNNYGEVKFYGTPASTVLSGAVTWPMDRTPPTNPIGDPA